jgi:O-antigen/teichoic acid export membrane protein
MELPNGPRSRTLVRASRLARNSVLTFVGLAVPSLVGIVTIPPIIAGLGPERFGILTLIWLVLGYLGTFDLGLGRAVTKFVAEAVSESRSRLVPRIVGTTMAIGLAFGLLTSGVLAALTPWITTRVLRLSGEPAAEMVAAFYLVAATLPIAQMGNLLRGTIEAFQRFDLANAIKVPASIASFVLPLAGVWLHMSLGAIVVLLLIARLLALLAYLLLCARLVPGLLATMRVDLALLLSLFRFGGWTTVSTIMLQLHSYAERFMLGHFLTLASVTYYSAPLEAINRLSIFPASISTALFPDFSRQSPSSRQSLAPIMARAIKYLLLLLVPITALGIIFTKDLLVLWLGPDFAQAATASRLLLACFLFSAIGYIPLTVVYGQGRPRWKAILDVCELPLFVGLCMQLIPTHGLAGAAMAKLSVQVIDFIGLLWMASVILRTSPASLLAGRGRQAVYLCGALLLGGLLLIESHPALRAKVLLSVAGLLAYGLLVLRMATDEHDWMLIPGAHRVLQRIGLAAKSTPEAGPGAVS